METSRLSLFARFTFALLLAAETFAQTVYCPQGSVCVPKSECRTADSTSTICDASSYKICCLQSYVSSGQAAYQPDPYGGNTGSPPSYQPDPYGAKPQTYSSGRNTGAPSYQPDPYAAKPQTYSSSAGITGTPYQPDPYGQKSQTYSSGGITGTPSYQPDPYGQKSQTYSSGGITGTPSYQPDPYAAKPQTYSSGGITGAPSYQPDPYAAKPQTYSSGGNTGAPSYQPDPYAAKPQTYSSGGITGAPSYQPDPYAANSQTYSSGGPAYQTDQYYAAPSSNSDSSYATGGTYQNDPYSTKPPTYSTTGYSSGSTYQSDPYSSTYSGGAGYYGDPQLYNKGIVTSTYQSDPYSQNYATSGQIPYQSDPYYGKSDPYSTTSPYGYSDYGTGYDSTYVDYYEAGYRGPRISSEAQSILYGHSYIEECGIRKSSQKRHLSAYESDDGAAGFAEFPWQVAILLRIDSSYGQYGNKQVYKFLCGATVIHPIVILTAAHCAKGKQLSRFKVHLGDWNLHGSQGEMFPTIERTVTDIIVHDYYNPSTFAHDIALMVLNKPVDFGRTPHIGPVCLPPLHFKFTPTSKCFLVGWGQDVYKPSYGSNILKYTSVNLIKDCSAKLKRAVPSLTNSYFDDKDLTCIVGVLGKDACAGDGGAAVVCPIPSKEVPVCKGGYQQCKDEHYFVAGVISWGSTKCADPYSVTVITDVTKHVEWIREKLKAFGGITYQSYQTGYQSTSTYDNSYTRPNAYDSYIQPPYSSPYSAQPYLPPKTQYDATYQSYVKQDYAGTTSNYQSDGQYPPKPGYTQYPPQTGYPPKTSYDVNPQYSSQPSYGVPVDSQYAHTQTSYEKVDPQYHSQPSYGSSSYGEPIESKYPTKQTSYDIPIGPAPYAPQPGYGSNPITGQYGQSTYQSDVSYGSYPPKK